MAAIVADDRPQDAGWIFGATFVSNVVANIVLVPHFGIVAAGWTTFGTEALLVVAASVVLATRRIPVAWPQLAWPGVVAGGVMTLAVLPLRHLPLAVPIAAGGAVYAVLLLVFRVPSRLGLSLRRGLPSSDAATIGR
jgi:O-antigen/teichoic acid export membrane protein